LQKNEGLHWIVNAYNLLFILPPAGKLIHLYLSYLLNNSVEIIRCQVHHCNLLCREKRGWPWQEILSRVLDALSKAHDPLTSGILFGLYIKNVSLSVATAKRKLLVIERSLEILPE